MKFHIKKSRFKDWNNVTKMKFHIKQSRFIVKSWFKEWNGADGGHSLNRDFTVVQKTFVICLPEWFSVRDADHECLSGLPGQSPAALVHDGAWYEHGHRFINPLIEQLLNGEKGRFGVRGVEDGLHEQHIDSTVQKTLDLLFISLSDLVKGHVSKLGFLHRRRNGESPVRGAQSAGHEPRAAGQPLHVVCGSAGDAGGVPVDAVDQVLGVVIRLGDKSSVI